MLEASRGAGAQVCDCKRDWLWVRYLLEQMRYFHFLHFGVEAKRAVVSAIQRDFLPEFGGKWVSL